eukprot:4483167-Alexandrium_andersonii.AAC.1
MHTADGRAAAAPTSAPTAPKPSPSRPQPAGCPRRPMGRQRGCAPGEGHSNMGRLAPPRSAAA